MAGQGSGGYWCRGVRIRAQQREPRPRLSRCRAAQPTYHQVPKGDAVSPPSLELGHYLNPSPPAPLPLAPRGPLGFLTRGLFLHTGISGGGLRSGTSVGARARAVTLPRSPSLQHLQLPSLSRVTSRHAPGVPGFVFTDCLVGPLSGGAPCPTNTPRGLPGTHVG